MRNRPKQWLTAALAAVLAASLLTGCQGGETPESRVPVDERVTVAEDSTVSTSATEPIVTPDPSREVPVTTGSDTAKETVKTTAAKPEKTTAKTTAPTKPPHDPMNDKPFPPDVMPIGAWVAPPRADISGRGNASFITDAQYKMLAESGINLIYGLYEMAGSHMEDILKSMDLCEKYGIKYLVRDSVVTEGDEALMKRSMEQYMHHPAFAGVKVQDEPGTEQFDLYREGQPIYKKMLPNKYYYINLLPSYASPSQLQYGAATKRNDGTMTFDRYLREYVEKVQPEFLSYDYYAIGGPRGTVQQGYFNELSTFRKIALEEDIPYWVFIQACSFGGMRRPNKAELLWQVNTSLAYGAKGIQYFCYFIPLEDPGAFPGCFIDKNGKKTEIYDYGQLANKQIAACDQVLMACDSKGVIVTGPSIDESIPERDKLTKYGALKGIKATGAGFITGCFDHKGKDAFYVANNSISASGTATLSFTKEVHGSYTVNGVSKEFRGRELKLTLEAGSGALVALA